MSHFFPKIVRETIAKEAWMVLKKEFQGSLRLIIVKIQIICCDFEIIHMKNGELV